MKLPILVFLILVTAERGLAQPSPPSSFFDDGPVPYRTNFNAATAVLIVVIVSAFFFLAFFSVYFRRCSSDRSAVAPAGAGAVTATSRRGARRGLDPAVIETFPMLSYSAASGMKIGKEALECAVCLSEFSDEEMLRLLPRCCHVFHPECIDTWLESHVTCPVCRDNLSAVSVGASDGGSPAIIGSGEGEGSVGGDAEVAIDVTRMGRSHSTGHVDRFTLRLPEHVRREIVAAGSLRRSASVVVVSGGSGEGSMRRGSSRGLWAGLMRVSTWRRGEAAPPPITTAEGSAAKKGRESVTMKKGEQAVVLERAEADEAV